MNVEEIVSDIKNNIIKEKKDLHIPEEDLSETMKSESVSDAWYRTKDQMNQISEYRPIEYYEPQVKTLKKRVIRLFGKLVKCVIWPMLEELNHFNAGVSATFQSQESYLEKEKNEVELLKAQVASLQAQLDELRELSKK